MNKPWDKILSVIALIEELNKPWDKSPPGDFHGDQTTPTKFPASSGSAAILHTCWTPNDLKGNAAERAIRPLPIPDTDPPLRLAPESTTSGIASASGCSIRQVILPNGLKLVALTLTGTPYNKTSF